MNFGYPNTPYATNMGTEQYMGNVGTNPAMGYAPQTDYMPIQGGCGCGMQTPFMGGYSQTGYGMGMPFIGGNTQQGCGQVLQQTCAVDIPYYVNYNTHVVNNVVRRHIQIPVYSQTQETIYFDEWQAGYGCVCNR